MSYKDENRGGEWLRFSGIPTISGRRIPAMGVAKMALTDSGRQTLVDGYDLSDEEIEDAASWWAKVQEYQRIAA